MQSDGVWEYLNCREIQWAWSYLPHRLYLFALQCIANMWTPRSGATESVEFASCWADYLSFSRCCACSEMAEVCMSVSRKHLCCSICLNLLKDPVILPCQHNFCRSCITRHWDIQTEVWSCPLCKRTFSPKPILMENVVLAETVEKLTRVEPHHTERSGAGRIDVECNVCIGGKYKAVKSCVSCLCSYCQAHFHQHENVFSGDLHEVIDVTGPLHESFCHLHHKPLEMCCHSDKQFICYFCTRFQHKNHNIVTSEMERKKKQVW